MTDRIMDQAQGAGWVLYNGDSAEVLPGLPAASVDLAVFSPPFSSTYTYSPSDRDLGNVPDDGVFWEQFGFITSELLRLLRPGRLAAVHVANLPAYENTHGYSGRRDFRGDTIRHFEQAGFYYHSEITIDKNPQALRHGQRVLTPDGWARIEDLSPGDQVIGSDGAPTKVEGVWPQGRGDVYRVTFSDGATVDCDAAHRWTVRSLAGRETDTWRTFTTAELSADGLYSPGGRRRWEVPIVRPVQFAPARELPLDPYVLGALLGDGNVTQRASVTLHTQRAVADRIASLLPEGHTIREQAGTGKGDDTATFHIGHPEWHRNDVLTALRDLGVQGCRAWEKCIPGPYFTASLQARRELLRGLLDTDGTIKRNGSVWFGTTSEGLARDVAEIVQGLGGIARLRSETVRRYRHNGEDRNGRTAWLVCIALDGDPLVTLPSKVERWRGSRRAWHREIASIERAGTDDRTCITVAADDGLFVTEGCVVTHNSQAIRTHSKGLLFVQLQRDAAAMWQAWADYLVVFRAPGKNDKPIPSELTQNEWIEYARPVWYGIQETDVLGTHEARESDDERHLCPLQLPVIERAVRLWSAPGETVLSPFAGIGSEGVGALRHRRRFVGVELKPAYFRVAARNLKAAEAGQAQGSLLDGLAS